MASRRDQKQQSTAKKPPAANQARDASASVSITGIEDASESSPPAAKAKAESVAILAAISDMSKRMEDRFNNLEVSLQAIQTTVTELDSRISTVEMACSDHDTELTQLKQQYRQLDENYKLLREKITDLEARSRRQNIKVVGLPERAEGKNPVDFLANFLRDLLGPEHFSTPIEIDRAHRLGQPPDSGARPRVMIARIHNFQKKEKILRLARENTPLTYEGRRIHLYPDFPAETLKRRQPFEEVRKKLINAGMRTGFLYPARLRVTKGTDIDRIFNTPEDADLFLLNYRATEEG